MPEQEQPITLKRAELDSLGSVLYKNYTEHENNRGTLLDQFLKNYRQYRGKYDPEILSKIPANFSKAYPKITRIKTKSLVAKLMEMLFPSAERNWMISPTPVPNISREDMQRVIQGLKEASQQGELTEDVIEEGIMKFAQTRADMLGKEIDDQLVQTKFKDLAKKVIKSAVMYGIGVLRGPMVDTVTHRHWEPNEQGEYEAVEHESLYPYYEFVSVWDFLPDYSLKSIRMNDRFFERHIMARHELNALKNRDDFFEDVINDYLYANQDGDFKETDYDVALKETVGKEETPGSAGAPTSTRLYHVKQCVGYVTGKELRDVGMNIDDDKLNDDILVDVWFLGEGRVIKIAQLPYASPLNFYHFFILDEEDEEVAIGPALPEDIRDSQMAVAAATRMMMDNAGVTTGAMFEINRDLLAPGQENADIHAFKIFWREGVGAEANYPAIRQYRFDSHINELMSIINLFREISDEESLLPKWAIGGESRPSEGLRTAQGTSMLFGASNMTMKDVVRNFDKFNESVLESLAIWNSLFHPQREKLLGDYNIRARGSSSLMAKELRAQALNNMALSLTPGEREHLDERKWVEERLKVHDLESDLLLDKDIVEQNRQREFEIRKREADVKNATESARAKKLLTSAAKELADAASKGQLTKAQILEIMSKVAKNQSNADATDTKADIEFLNTLRELSKPDIATVPTTEEQLSVG